MDIPEEFVFDVQVKRAHEYKRQLMNALCLADFYFEIKNGGLADMPPTAFIFGAKAAPGYRRAKAVIRYINRFAELVNNDPDVNGKMRIVFVQNYNCSYAEKIIPAADISEQISPARNGGLRHGQHEAHAQRRCDASGTMDGANVEIVRQAGLENNYIFGGTVEENNAVRDTYDPEALYDSDERIRRAMDTLVDGTVPTDDDQKELFDAILKGASWHRPAQLFRSLARYLKATVKPAFTRSRIGRTAYPSAKSAFTSPRRACSRPTARSASTRKPSGGCTEPAYKRSKKCPLRKLVRRGHS